MIEVAGKPIIERQIEWLRLHDIREIIICAGYLRDVIINRIGSGRKLSVSVGYSIEEEPLGTGGAVRNARTLIDGERFIVINGDILTDINPWNLAVNMDQSGTKGRIASVPLPCPFGIIDINEGLARGFIEKPILKDRWINAGVYCLSTTILDALPERGNLEQTTLPTLAHSGNLQVTKYDHAYWRSIDSHKDIEEANRELGFVNQIPMRINETFESAVRPVVAVTPEMKQMLKALAFDSLP